MTYKGKTTSSVKFRHVFQWGATEKNINKDLSRGDISLDLHAWLEWKTSTQIFSFTSFFGDYNYLIVRSAVTYWGTKT